IPDGGDAQDAGAEGGDAGISVCAAEGGGAWARFGEPAIADGGGNGQVGGSAGGDVRHGESAGNAAQIQIARANGAGHGAAYGHVADKKDRPRAGGERGSAGSA